METHEAELAPLRGPPKLHTRAEPREGHHPGGDQDIFLEGWLGGGEPVKQRQERWPPFGDFAVECEIFSQAP